MAQEQTQRDENAAQEQGDKPQMRFPGLDYAGVQKFLNERKQNTQGAQPQGEQSEVQQPQSAAPENAASPQPQVEGSTQGQTQQQTNVNPDVVAAQEEFKNIKDGDTYTDENGQKWEWSVMEFNVVPEESKDEIVDDIFSEEEGVEGEGEGEGDDEDANLEAGLDIALQVLREEEDAETSNAVAKDEADRILDEAIRDVLGESAIAEDADFTDPKEMTVKRQGYDVPTEREAPYYLRKRGKVKQNPDGTWHVEGYQPKAQKHAMENARRSHRRTVAATWEQCKAKDKARCPYHGAAYMTDMLGKIIKSNGIPLGKFGILMHDPESGVKRGKKDPIPYRILFSTPEGTTEDARKKVIKAFFDKNPNIIFEADTNMFGKYKNNSVFAEKSIEDIDDMPVDAPSQEAYEAGHDTAKEQEYGERAKARGSVSWTNVDELPLWRYFDMLSERPTNIVECNEDMLRYAKQFPEMLPEGISLDDVKGVYDTFMKANAKKKGLQAFLANGEMVDKAEALAVAAEKGMEKAGEVYYDASEEAYGMAADVFNSVKDNLVEQFMGMRREVFGMPSGSTVHGETSQGKYSFYFGDKYKSSQNKFPMSIGGEEEEMLREMTLDYKRRWNAAARNVDFILLGCEQREPLMVSYGLNMLQVSVDALKNAKSMLGEMQDFIIENQTETWRKKNGIRMPKEKIQEQKGEAPTPAAEEPTATTNAPEPVAPAEAPKKSTKKTGKGKGAEVPASEEPQPEATSEEVKPVEERPEKVKGTATKKQETSENKPATEKPTETAAEEKEEPAEKPEATTVRETPRKPQKANAAKREEPLANSDGAGVQILRGMEIPDKPTVESATELNKKFSDLEKRMRGLTFVYKSGNADPDDWKAAEEEMKTIKREIDGIIKKAQGKGYQWTKDNTTYSEFGSSARPLGMPTNFRISGIKGEDGNTISIPYKPPKMGIMDIPKSIAKSGKTESAKTKTEEPKKPASARVNYDKIFSDAEAKLGNVFPDGMNLTDLVEMGYVVKEYKDKQGNMHHLMSKVGDGPNGIDTSYPYYVLDRIYADKGLGDAEDEQGYTRFVNAIERRVKKFRDELYA